MTPAIVLITPTLDEGGAEKQLTLLATRLPTDLFDVHVCTLTRSGPFAAMLERQHIPLTHIDKRWKVDPAAYWRLQRFLSRRRPALVHTWLFAANAYGRAAALRAGVPHLVAGERCVDRWKSWQELAIDRYLGRFTERIVTNSSGVSAFYADHGIPREKLLVIPNGIDPPDPAAALPRHELLEQLRLPAGARLIGAVGRLWPQKRYRDLIWSAELLRVARPDIHLLIVGDGPERNRLEQFCRQLQLQDHVHFLGHRGDVPRIMPHFDCFWLGSGYEGQSNALMEAMALGKPVVATDIPGNRDLVVPAQTGYLVPVGDRAERARWTNLLLDDASLAHRLGSAGRRRVLAEFTVDQMVAGYVALYRELVQA